MSGFGLAGANPFASTDPNAPSGGTDPFARLFSLAPQLLAAQPPVSPIPGYFPPIPVQPGSVTSPSGQTTTYGSALPQQSYLPPPQPHGVLGFFENALHDLTGMAQGISSIAGAGFHDIMKTLSFGQLGGGWETADMVKAMPEAIKQDYLSRYGSFGKFITGLYQHPLSFLNDAATIATLGGAGAVQAAKFSALGSEAAAKIGEVGDAARAAEALQAAQKGLTAAQGIGDVAGATKAASLVEKFGSRLDELGYARDTDPNELFQRLAPIRNPDGSFSPGPMQQGLPAFTQRVLPGYGSQFPGGFRYVPEGAGAGATLAEHPLAMNPFRRVLETKLYQPFLTTPVEKFAEGGLMGQEKLGETSQILAHAQQLGLDRIERPVVSLYKVKNLVNRMVGDAAQAAYVPRNQITGEIVQAAKDTKIGADPEGFAHVHQDLQGFEEPWLHSAGLTDQDVALIRSGKVPKDQTEALAERVSTALNAKAADASAKANEFVHLGHQPFDVSVPGEIPGGPPPLTPADLEVNRGLDKAQLLEATHRALQGVGLGTGAGYVDGDLPIARVLLNSFNEAPDALAKLTQLPGSVMGIDNLIKHPRELMDRAIHAYHKGPDGAVTRIEFHTPLSQEAADTARYTREWAQHIPETLGAIKQFVDDGKPIPEGMDPAGVATLQDQYNKAVARHAALMEPVVQEMRHHLNGEGFTPNQLFQERMRLLFERTTTVPAMRRGELNPAQAFDREYLPARLASGANFDPKLGDFTGGADTMSLHMARQLEGYGSPVYFPHMSPYRGRFSDFLMSKRLVGANAAKQQSFLRRNEGVLFREGAYSTDPIEAYSRRAARAITHQATWNFSREVLNRFSRGPLDAEALRALDPTKERIFAPDGMLRFFKAKVAADDIVQKYLTKGLAPDAATEQGLRDLLPSITDDTIQSFTGVGKSKVYAIPKVVADQIEAQLRPTFGPKTRLFWDQPTKLWRAAVLMASPRFAVRHFFGHLMFIKAQGGRFSDVIRQLDPRFREVLNQVIPDEALGGFFGGSRGLAQYSPVPGGAGEGTTLGSLISQAQRSSSVVARGAGAATGFFRNVNTGIERVLRRAGWLTAAERVMAKESMGTAMRSFWTSKSTLDRVAEVGANPRLAEQATREVNHFFGDYSHMTPFERNFVRPYIFPFWSFYKHVGKLLITMPFENPERFALLRNLSTVGQDFQQGIGPTPDYLKGALPFGPGDQPGTTRFLSPTAANPFEAVFRTPLSLLHPILKTALEYAMGRSLDTGKEFTAPNVVEPFGGTMRFQVDAQGHAVPVSAVRPNPLELILRSFPQYQLLESLVSGGSTYDTATLLSLLEGQGVIPQTGQPGTAKYPSNTVNKIVLPQLGISTYDFGLQRYQQQVAQQEAQAMLQYLRSLGLVPQAGQQALATVP